MYESPTKAQTLGGDEKIQLQGVSCSENICPIAGAIAAAKAACGIHFTAAHETDVAIPQIVLHQTQLTSRRQGRV